MGGTLHPALAVVFSILMILTLPTPSRSESLASKNKRGNRLFEQGKYEDAEKAYLSAQGDDPGKPEIQYNIGNSLIRQRKYHEGIQALGQSIRKGDKGIKEKGWYNTGTALFSAGNYRDSIDALIQALKLDPADRDAKHNLELALTKLREQERQKSGKNREQNSKDANKDNSKNDKDARQQPSNQNRNEPGGQKEPKPSTSPQETRPAGRDESMTRDRAMQLLDAMQNQEMEEQRKLLERRAREKANGKDW
jgi:Ca-activated chloride channel homolog